MNYYNNFVLIINFRWLVSSASSGSADEQQQWYYTQWHVYYKCGCMGLYKYILQNEVQYTV